ncbi:MAG: VCBS repeat-containing protein [Armatimonadetes bacterium]|nr:VCBS repeat-containing protein [Armatimonadota bacterium]
MPDDRNHLWITRGFEGFSRGRMGNAGQNLYVSRAGVLQRIHQFDLNRNGFADVLVCNSQNHWERPPIYIYSDPFGRPELTELPSDGAISGVVADLNGDGYDDLALAMRYNGTRTDLNALIYYGGPDGLSRQRCVSLPAPTASSIAAGDFNGDGRMDLAIITTGRLRVFNQGHFGFEREVHTDLDIKADQICAADLDDDGYCDLYLFSSIGPPRVAWGGPEGLRPDAISTVPVADRAAQEAASETPSEPEDHVTATQAVPSILELDGLPHLFVPLADRVLLVPVRGRGFGEPIVLLCRSCLSAAIGDVNSDGYPDLVLAARDDCSGTECSWCYWGSAEGFSEDRRTPLATSMACDVAVGHLDDSPCAAVVIATERDEVTFSVPSLVFRGTPEGIDPAPVRLLSHNVRRALIGHFRGADRPELVFVNHRARRSGGDIDPVIYTGGPEGFAPERRIHLKGRDCVDALCVDIFDRNLVDIVTANCSENAVHLDPGSFLFKGRAEGYRYEPDVVFPTVRAHGVVCGDINRDGYLDLVFGGFQNPELLVYYGGPDGFDVHNPQRLEMRIDGVTYSETRWILLADLNNDGWLDLFVPHINADRSFILWGGPEGFDISRRQMICARHASCAQAADLTGNGWLDLVVGGHAPSPTGPHDSFVYVYWNGPQGIREENRTELPAYGVNALQLADFNGDGILDLFVSNYHEGRTRDVDSFIYWGQPGGHFDAEDRKRIFMHSASGCVAADFDEDGRIDLAVAYHKVNNDHVGHSAIWWNGPEGFRPDRVTQVPSNGPHGMVRLPVGSISDRGPEEHYISEPRELDDETRRVTIEWDADIPLKTWVRAQLRCAGSLEALPSARWVGAGGTDGYLDNGDGIDLPGAARWIQYRLALGATNSVATPRVREVRVRFR